MAMLVWPKLMPPMDISMALGFRRKVEVPTEEVAPPAVGMDVMKVVVRWERCPPIGDSTVGLVSGRILGDPVERGRAARASLRSAGVSGAPGGGVGGRAAGASAGGASFWRPGGGRTGGGRAAVGRPIRLAGGAPVGTSSRSGGGRAAGGRRSIVGGGRWRVAGGGLGAGRPSGERPHGRALNGPAVHASVSDCREEWLTAAAD